MANNWFIVRSALVDTVTAVQVLCTDMGMSHQRAQAEVKRINEAIKATRPLTEQEGLEVEQ